jgi:hypothetical protein
MFPRLLSVTEVAQRLGLSVSTVRWHRTHRSMPDPDGQVGPTPFWTEATIDGWAARRPGRGRPAASWTRAQRRDLSAKMIERWAGRRARPACAGCGCLISPEETEVWGHYCQVCAGRPDLPPELDAS